ncbi:MAG: hypothetical protein FWF83_08545, partial [Clostridiales bacterium]|nr:hypothetical protein [Clostridiales bacterium]
MNDHRHEKGKGLQRLLDRINLNLRAKLILIFLVAMIIPIILLTYYAWNQHGSLGISLRSTAVIDSSKALNDSAIESIERMTTDTAKEVADFLYARDADIRLLSKLSLSDEALRIFGQNSAGRLTQRGEWALSEDLLSWKQVDPPSFDGHSGSSSNEENNQNDAFHFRPPSLNTRALAPLYDEITYIDLDGNEIFKYVSPDSSKTNYPMEAVKRNVADKRNTYIQAEGYYEALRKLAPGEIYVSDVIGAYVGSNYIGMYTPGVLAKGVPESHPNYAYLKEAGSLPLDQFMTEAGMQSYAGMENPNGRRFEGIVRWGAPVTDNRGAIVGYVTMALNHDHIMEFVDYSTPMNERDTALPSAFEGNYAFIWDYQCRSICHPRHNSIVGYDPKTGEPEVPWLESSIYTAWQQSGVEKWTSFVKDWPVFDHQSRSKAPARELTAAGLVGLDGRYLNNAPQCIGWMDLTESGGAGAFYIP